jgi:undecaprenyl diphosphate synthase
MRNDSNKLRHLAIIMDGNSRWALNNNMSRKTGHYKGYKAAYNIVERCLELSIPELTLFALSKENLMSRPKFEINYLTDIFYDSFVSNIKKLVESGIKVKIIGDFSVFGAKLQDAINLLISSTKSCGKMQVNIALNYSGQWHIEQSFKVFNNLPQKPADISAWLKAKMNEDISDCDLLIRTGDEKRVSNFLLWHIAYSEIYFSSVFWPEFNNTELEKIISWFESRARRFGGR